jgi:hypothetical protein
MTYPISLPLKRTNKNVGGLFVIDLNKRIIVKEHKHYKTALNCYRKLGGYGHAIIVPKADALNYLASTLVEEFSTTRL